MTTPPRIYLAGPEVFHPQADALSAAKKAACAEAGFEGVFPLDTTLDLTGLAKLEAARRISLANEALIRSCDLVIANMTPFRGVALDSGTAYEVGYARALGKPVLGYTNTEADYQTRATVFQRVAADGRWGLPDAGGPGTDIEDFDLAENLMIAVAVAESGGHVVAQDVEAGEEMTDITGFRICLEQAAMLMGIGRPRS